MEDLEETPEPVKAFEKYRDNSELIAQVAQLGFLKDDWRVLDPTWGEGTFWKGWQPQELWGSDLNPAKSPKDPADFTDLPHADRSFDAVVFDGPYKLNGTPDEQVDARYGVDEYTRWQDRMDLLVRGAVECARKADKVLLVKCMDQVCSGKVRWQTRILADAVEDVDLGDGTWLRLADMLYMLGGRAQPKGRRQRHAAHNYSTMMIFVRERA